jgi:hypothetical protein
MEHKNHSIVAGFSILISLAVAWPLLGQTVEPPQPPKSVVVAVSETQGVPSPIAGEKEVSPSRAPAAVPNPMRTSPAYPDDFWRSFGRDGQEFLPMVYEDSKAMIQNPFSLACFAAAGITGITLQGHHADNSIADHYEKHGPQLNTFWDTVGDAGGNPGTHFAIAGALYFSSLIIPDNPNYSQAKTLLSALVINDLLTVGLKVAVNNKSPNGDDLAWPSGHTSSSFTMATVLYDQYGPWVGIPAFGFASFVGYERIDASNHNFSDVISGALIGIAVGHAVSKHHDLEIAGFKLTPYLDPESGQMGVAMARRF